MCYDYKNIMKKKMIKKANTYLFNYGINTGVNSEILNYHSTRFIDPDKETVIASFANERFRCQAIPKFEN